MSSLDVEIQTFMQVIEGHFMLFLSSFLQTQQDSNSFSQLPLTNQQKRGQNSQGFVSDWEGKGGSVSTVS